MPKIHSIYPYAKLIDCPFEWSYYKEVKNIPLLLMESERKYPGKLFFCFGGLRSTIITKLETKQKSLNDN